MNYKDIYDKRLFERIEKATKALAYHCLVNEDVMTSRNLHDWCLKECKEFSQKELKEELKTFYRAKKDQKSASSPAEIHQFGMEIIESLRRQEALAESRNDLIEALQKKKQGQTIVMDPYLALGKTQDTEVSGIQEMTESEEKSYMQFMVQGFGS